MATHLIALSSIPHSARAAERAARAKHTDPLDAAEWQVELRPGCHGEAYAPVIGWVVSAEAASALSQRETRMPDHTTHRRLIAIHRPGVRCPD